MLPGSGKPSSAWPALVGVLGAALLCACPARRPTTAPDGSAQAPAAPESANGAGTAASQRPDGESAPSGQAHQDPAERERAERLARAGELIESNRFDEAAAALAQVLRSEPTVAQRRQADQLHAALEDRRRAWGELEALVAKLASEKREEVLAAQNRFFERADVALPLLDRATRDKDPKRVAAALETLARLRRPEQVLPIMVGVLRRPEQEPVWPEAIAQIESVAGPGAGEPLLLLALAADRAEQRAAALRALARVVDPPQRTVVALLPWIYQDGPELAAALEAAAHAVDVHHLHDLGTRRGLEGELTPQQLRQLDALPDRLAKLLAGTEGDVTQAARRLAVATRQVPAEPLAGVKVLAYSAQQEDSPAAALLDGAWNTTDTKQMWRYPAGRPGSVVLDLGAVRTVAGVRVWNLNEPGGVGRGWKEIAVYVADSPAALADPAATGQIPQAPGAADAPNYSVTVPVDFRRGRYVRLRAAATWSQDGSGGLTEVQVLGF